MVINFHPLAHIYLKLKLISFINSALFLSSTVNIGKYGIRISDAHP